MKIIIMIALLVFASFFLGVIVGISDCKRRFNIPYGATAIFPVGDGIFSFEEVVTDGRNDS